MRKYCQIEFFINYEILGYIETGNDLIILDGGKLFSSWIYVELIKSYVDRIFIRKNEGKIRLSLVTLVLENIVLDQEGCGKIFYQDSEIYFDNQIIFKHESQKQITNKIREQIHQIKYIYI